MRLGAEFSIDRKYRYRLWRQWREDKPALMWIMLNPSTADERKDDPTIKRCIGYSLNWGYGGCEIFNIFAWRSTDPGALLNKNIEPTGGYDHDKKIIEAAVIDDRPIVCAWGNVYKSLLWRPKEVLGFLDGLDLRCLKTTMSGQPAHPLYLSSKLALIEYKA